jgi:hypothetical protein
VTKPARWRRPCRLSLPEPVLRHAVDVGEPPVGVGVQIDDRDQRRQAVLGALGDLDRQRRLVKGLD